MTDIVQLPGTTPQPPAPDDEKLEYRAVKTFLEGEERLFIQATMSNGDVRLINYAYFVEAISVAPDRLAFVYTNGALYLRGSHLRTLLPMLQQKQVKAFQLFDDNRHLEPEPGSAIIDNLEWRYPEEVRRRSK